MAHTDQTGKESVAKGSGKLILPVLVAGHGDVVIDRNGVEFVEHMTLVLFDSGQTVVVDEDGDVHILDPDAR